MGVDFIADDEQPAPIIAITHSALRRENHPKISPHFIMSAFLFCLPTEALNGEERQARQMAETARNSSRQARAKGSEETPAKQKARRLGWVAKKRRA
jgi:hypothetical protein